MESTFHEVYFDVKKAIDFAFEGKFILNFYDYLKIKGVRKAEVEEFIESSTANELSNLVMDLDDYLEGGDDNIHKQLLNLKRLQLSAQKWYNRINTL